ncbi:hypothetical protein SAMN02745219_03407 [Desulfofundulus thermosubterraneus DSM 16057]|uniref:Vitamin B12 dependent methionine synthase, activation domain n=2 Tax=Desulfofundulus TaxID=2282741 RepID=A0A1M6MDP1_9FIRM|nr:hypothetical protein SAMN02745219_03407 [Desulfofundulus thermosubterraneus DSM 16057]
MYGLMDYYKFDVRLTEKDVSSTGWNCLSRTTSTYSSSLVNEILQEAHRLARAEAVCRAVPVVKTTGREIFLEGGQALTSSLLVRLAGTARSLLLVVCTLGHMIDRRVEEYNRKGLAAHAYFLDIAGTCLIEAAGRQLVEKIKTQLEACGFKSTIPLGPGHSYWKSLQDQRIIYDLVNPAKIGVTILKSGIMLPKKSVSMVMGIGRELPPSAENHCYYCSIRRKCPLSRARDPL